MGLEAISRRALLWGAGGSAFASLAGCKVVPIAEGGASAGGFDAKTWAADLWSSKVLPYFATQAKPLADVLKALAGDLDEAGKQYGYRPSAEGAAWTFAVSGSATVRQKNTTSRAGTLVLAVTGADMAAPVVLQIGPVIIGSAIRDALPFVDFKDFTNQLDFADASKALTVLALASITPLVAKIEEGSQIKFAGAFSMTSKSDPVRITPVTLAVQS